MCKAILWSGLLYNSIVILRFTTLRAASHEQRNEKMSRVPTTRSRALAEIHRSMSSKTEQQIAQLGVEHNIHDGLSPGLAPGFEFSRSDFLDVNWAEDLTVLFPAP
ncbi:unnamed protein product [Diplocarpon coronariae]